ncbi:hypothetical protein B1987_03660 [Mycobacterium kansasii]|nr:hypothetical protein B1987_03660 [Mycobacterium kansasii]
MCAQWYPMGHKTQLGDGGSGTLDVVVCSSITSVQKGPADTTSTGAAVASAVAAGIASPNENSGMTAIPRSALIMT